MDLARRCGLAAIAITDHDTLAGVMPARAVAPASLEVIAGVEITAEHLGRELHLLGYFVDGERSALDSALADVRESRTTRYYAMIERLRALGVSLQDETFTVVPDALGRRHLAEMLVRQGKAGSVREAFQRWLGDNGPADVAKRRVPVGEAIRLVRAAGGVASWAHPSYDGARQHLADLAALGLGAVEAEYPDLRRSQSDQVRAWAQQLGLAITGGSDCHGPGPRGVGACTIGDAELDELRNHRRRGEDKSGGA